MALDKLRVYVPDGRAKEIITEAITRGISEAVTHLHPTDKVDALRDIAGRCNSSADAAQDYNEEHGVPERTEDQS